MKLCFKSRSGVLRKVLPKWFSMSLQENAAPFKFHNSHDQEEATHVLLHIIHEVHSADPDSFKLLLDINDCDIPSITNTINNIHPRVSFTIEKETNGSINYLDLNIAKNFHNKYLRYWQSKKRDARPQHLHQYHLHPSHALHFPRNLRQQLTQISSHSTMGQAHPNLLPPPPFCTKRRRRCGRETTTTTSTKKHKMVEEMRNQGEKKKKL
ncbi:unnamed protein product [Timema podura]|uniref:Uncharacterized protein n=1 Tax=Timema podura TaxID=61482 RepID=A0ABN7P2N8_TIMPD|nr:unnamed protein product [Timema podura]